MIGFDRPFVIIGERINPTGRKKLAEEMKAGNFETVIADAIAQVEAGAQMLDVNAGIPLADEPAILRADDRARPVDHRRAALDRLLDRRGARGRALGLPGQGARQLGHRARTSRWSACCRSSRSTAPRSSRSRTTRPGISEDPDVRFEVARKIVSRAADYGIPREDIVVDPLVMPIGAMGTAGRQVFRLVRRLQEELGVNSTCGASNVSFGLPNRPALNAAFLPMAIASGLTSAITSPLHAEVRHAIWAADVMNGNDEHCATWIARNGDSRRGGADRPPRRPRRQAEGGRRSASTP